MLLTHPIIKKLSATLTTAFIGLWPILAKAQDITGLENPLGPGTTAVDPNEIFARVAFGFIIAIGAVTLFFVVLGGYIVLTAAGNSERYQKGKTAITYSIIGMIIAVGSYAILSTALSVATGGAGLPEFQKYRLTDPLGIESTSDLYGNRLGKFFVSGLGVLSVLMLVWGGLQWVMAAGNEEKIKKARLTLGYTFTGIVLVLGSYLIINFIYSPLYNLFSGGGTGQVAPPPEPEPADTQLVACFRRDLGRDYGATCDVETYSECLKPVGAKQRGQAEKGFTSCEDVGVCVQTSPGTGFHNRVAASDCNSGDVNSVKKFSPMNRGLADGTCPFTNQIGINDGTSEKPYYQCYADVTFTAGADLPSTEDSWACVRERQTTVKVCSSGSRPGTNCSVDGQCGIGGKCVTRSARTYQYDCSEELQNNCRRETANASHFPGTYYHRRFCSEVGYCELSWSGHKDCKNGVVEEQCTKLLFPSVGVPVPPWGCGYYDEVAGACYVPQSGISWHATGPNGKNCPVL